MKKRFKKTKKDFGVIGDLGSLYHELTSFMPAGRKYSDDFSQRSMDIEDCLDSSLNREMIHDMQ